MHDNKCMSAAAAVLVPFTFVAITLFATPGLAADAGAVVKACDHTKGCYYSQQKNGDISGCSPKSSTCFYCPADGKHQCFKVRKRGHANIGPGKIGGVKLTSGGVKQPSGHHASGAKHAIVRISGAHEHKHR